MTKFNYILVILGKIESLHFEFSSLQNLKVCVKEAIK